MQASSTVTRRLGRAHTREAAVSERRAPVALGAALAAAVAYAMFANGAIGLPEESRLQIGVAVIALGGTAALLYGRGLRLSPSPLALAGVALLAGFAAWSGLSIAWSVAPDESWLELNRAIAYTLVAGLALALGSSLPRAAERVAVGYLVIATVAAAYALGGKLFPWLEIPGVLDLNHTGTFSRLRAPLEYWNALGLVCVLAIPIAVRAAADLEARARRRGLSQAALSVLIVTLVLTYSRGGLLVLVVALAVLVAMSRDRLRVLATLLAGVLGAVPAAVVGVSADDLTTDGVSVSARTGDGLLFAAALAVGIAIALVLGRRAARVGERVALGPRGQARARRAGLAAVAAVALIALGALGFSERGIGGTISHQLDEFTEPKFDRQNDPARVLKTNSGNRWIWWEEAAGAFADRPLVGHGAGSFPLVHRLYRENRIEVRQPHNVPLEFLSETGLIGAGLGLGALGLLGLAAARNTRRRRTGPERGYAVALLVGAGAWGLHTLVDWDWDIPGVTLPALIFLGVLAARPPGEARTPSAPARARGRVLRFAPAAAALAVVIALAALPAVAQELTDDALTQAASNTAEDLDDAGEKAALAKRLNPFAVQPVFAQAAIAERGNQQRAAAALLVEAVERQPSNPSTWLRLARFQVLVDDSEAAQRSLITAVRLDPAFVQVYALALFAAYDERRSASATGTPLPVSAPVAGAPTFTPPLVPGPTPAAPGAPGALGTPPPAPTPVPVPVAPPTPAPPAPAPAPAPPAPPREPAAPPPSGDPFRLEG